MKGIPSSRQTWTLPTGAYFIEAFFPLARYFFPTHIMGFFSIVIGTKYELLNLLLIT